MGEQKIQREESLIGSLVLLSIALIVVISVINLSPDWLFTLFVGDLVICIVFTWDFVYRFNKAPQKSTFIKYHGFEILAIVTAIAIYRAG